MLIGRVLSGKLAVGDKVHAVDSNGTAIEQAKIIKIIKKFGMNQVELENAFAGDIGSIAGFQ